MRDVKDFEMLSVFLVPSNCYFFKLHGTFISNHAFTDFMENKLYWTDSKLNRIESCSLDGSSRVVVLEGLAQPYSLVVYGSDIYWSEWDTPSIKKMDKATTTVQQVTTEVSDKPTAIQVQPLVHTGCIRSYRRTMPGTSS